MASPFAVFRRNQKAGMAILTLLAMFAFIFLDTINRNAGGRGASGNDVVVKTNEGNIDRLHMMQLMQNRRRANEILAAVFQESWEAAQQQKQQLGSRQPMRFTFGHSSLQKDVLLGYLFRKEAQKTGLIVGDDAITSFLQQASEFRLTPDALRGIARNMQISLREVYDTLREELQAQYYFRYSRPHDPVTPAELWTYYQKLNVRQVLEVAELPVESFTAKVANPSDAELKTFFETYKNRYPNEAPDEDKPGFKQPPRVQLQYLTLNYEDVEKMVPDVTDKEVTEYYEKNKETLYKNNPFPEGQKPGDQKPADDKKPEEKKPEEKKDDAKKPEAPVKPADKPAEEKKPAEKAPEKKPEEKKADEKKPEAAKPPMTTPPAKPEAKPADKKQGARESRKPSMIAAAQSKDNAAFFAVDDKPAEKKDSAPKKAEEKKPETPAAKPAEPPKAAPPAVPKKEEPAKPSTPAPEKKMEPAKPAAPAATAKPATEAKPAVTPPATDKKPEADKKAEEPPYRPLDNNLKSEIKDQLLRERTNAKVQEIAKQMADKMTDIGIKYNAPILAVETDKAKQTYQVFMDLNGDGKFDKGEPEVTHTGKINVEQLTPEERAPVLKQVAVLVDGEMKAAAQALKTQYGATGMISFQDLKKLKGIGTTVELEAGPTNPFDNSAAPIERVAFGDESLFRPTKMEDSVTHDLYVVWKVRLQAEHVAKFEDEGIKAEVLNTWKLEHARPLAQKRGEALAELIRKSGKSMEESLAKQTATGDKGEDLKVETTPLFSWLRATEVPGPNPLAPETRPERSQPTFIKSPGETFMEIVFDKLKLGEVGVAPNADGSCLYVVKVKERTPSDEAGIATEREAFIKARLFGFSFQGMRLGTTPYDILSEGEQQQVIFDWVQQLEKQHHVEWLKEDETQDRDA